MLVVDEEWFLLVIGNSATNLVMVGVEFAFVFEAERPRFEDNVVGRSIPNDILNFHSKSPIHDN